MAVVPFALATTQARNVKGNNETLVNMYADTMPPAAKSQVVLIGTPGWELYLTVENPPIIGMHFFKSDLYIVTRTKMFKINHTNNLITLIGTVNFSTRDSVSIADNGINIVIVGGNGYYSDGVTVTQITDPSYYPSDTVTFQDGYFIFNRSGTNQFFISRLYAVTFDGTMYASAEGSPDNIVGLISTHQQLWIFGSKSIEVWYNSGDALFPFDRVQGSFSLRGCINYKTIAATNNAVYWVGDDNIVYMSNGYTPTPISTAAIEYRLGTRGTKDFRAFTYTEEGHYFYVLTIDDVTTLAYDMKTNLWHNRESLGGTWGLRNMVMNEQGVLYGADVASGNIYRVGLDYHTENGQTILRTAETSPFSNGVDYFTLNKFELDMETGKSLPSEEDTITLSFSDDGGVEFKNDHVISLGAQGERKKRVIWRRLGRHRNLTLKVTTRCKSQVNLIAAHAELS
jgi:hypothetical protein